MANSYIVLQKLCSVLSLSFVVLMATINATNKTKLVLRLLHRDSIFPSSCNPNLIISDFTNHAVNSSQEKSTGRSTLSHNDIIAPLVPYGKGLIFLVNVSIGEPPVPQLLAMDTGSSLTWVQPPLCTGCTPPWTPLYDPKSSSSSTCTALLCHSNDQCKHYFDYSDCGQESQCVYRMNYSDKSSCSGFIAFEKFTFMTSTGGISQVLNFLFGCGVVSHGTVQRLSGILGLQILNQYSLVSRFGKKFSYCIGNISDPHYMYNQLILGEGAVLEGYSTPLGIRDGHYAVSIQGISVGEKQLKINEQEFDSSAVVDSGSTLTLLTRSAFEPLKEQVVKLLDGLLQPVIVNVGRERPCYRGQLVRDLKGFPTVTLHLAEGTDLSLDIEGTFQRITDDIFCMAMDVPKQDTNVIGVLAQQFYNVGFDLNAMKVSFLNIECELLED